MKYDVLSSDVLNHATSMHYLYSVILHNIVKIMQRSAYLLFDTTTIALYIINISWHIPMLDQATTYVDIHSDKTCLIDSV